MIVMFFRINKHTFLAVNNITRKLNGSSNSTMDDINQITGYVQQFNNTLRPAIEGRLASIQSKLAALKQRIAKVRFSIAFLANCLRENDVFSTLGLSWIGTQKRLTH